MDDNREELLAEIASLYYEDDKTQAEIAKQFHMSRPSISNLLKEAREKGIVRISIQTFNADTIKNKKTIQEYYDLENVLIANLNSEEKESKSKVGQLCVELLETHLSNYKSIGIGWGTTMHEVINAASYIEGLNLEIIPLMGGISIQNIKYHSNHLAFQLAEKYKANVFYYYAPAIAENHNLADAFASSKMINAIKEKEKEIEIAIAGVGNPAESSTYRQLGYISNQEKGEIITSGAIGDILGSFFDENGEEVINDVSKRMFGMRLSDLKNVDEVIVLATGPEKIPSIKALLKQNFINHLIIDSNIASKLAFEINELNSQHEY